MSSVVYRRSYAEQTVSVRRTFATTTTIQAYGSGDGFSIPRTDFDDDEEIRVRGSVTPQDGSSLAGLTVDITVDDSPVGTAPLVAGNTYEFSLGTLLGDSSYRVRSTFPRTERPVGAMGATLIVDEYLGSEAEMTIGQGAYRGSFGEETIRVGITPEDITRNAPIIAVAVSVGALLLIAAYSLSPR